MSVNKNELISLIYHDLRGKIGNIMNISDLIANEIKLNPQEINEMIPAIKSSAVYIFEMIELLRFFEILNSPSESRSKKIKPRDELEFIGSKITNVSQLYSTGIEFLADEMEIDLNTNRNDFILVNFLILYLMIVDVKDAAALSVKFESENKTARIIIKILYRDSKNNEEKTTRNLEQFLDLKKNQIHVKIFNYLMDILEKRSVGLGAFESNSRLSTVILEFKVK